METRQRHEERRGHRADVGKTEQTNQQRETKPLLSTMLLLLLQYSYLADFDSSC